MVERKEKRKKGNKKTFCISIDKENAEFIKKHYGKLSDFVNESIKEYIKRKKEMEYLKDNRIIELKDKKIKFLVEIIIKYYNEKSGYLEKDDLKIKLEEYIKRKVEGLIVEFKDLNLKGKEILNEMENIEINGLGKLNDFKWWKEKKKDIEIAIQEILT